MCSRCWNHTNYSFLSYLMSWSKSLVWRPMAVISWNCCTSSASVGNQWWKRLCKSKSIQIEVVVKTWFFLVNSLDKVYLWNTLSRHVCETPNIDRFKQTTLQLSQNSMQYFFFSLFFLYVCLKLLCYNNNNNNIWHLYSALQRTQCFYMTDTVHIRQCNYVAAANKCQLWHSNTQNRRTWGLGNRWLFNGSFAKFSNEPWE